MKAKNWTVELSDGTTFSGKGALSSVEQRHALQTGTALILNLKSGKTAIIVNVTLPAKVFVASARTVEDEPAETTDSTADAKPSPLEIAALGTPLAA